MLFISSRLQCVKGVRGHQKRKCRIYTHAFSAVDGWRYNILYIHIYIYIYIYNLTCYHAVGDNDCVNPIVTFQVNCPPSKILILRTSAGLASPVRVVVAVNRLGRCRVTYVRAALPCWLTEGKVRGSIHWNRTQSQKKSPQWRHNEHDGVSNNLGFQCLLNRLFRHRSKKISKLRVTGLCEGNSPVTGEFPTQRTSKAENVSMWLHHHVFTHPISDEF